VLREQFAVIAPGLPTGLDVVVIARPGAAEYLEDKGSPALGARLAELAEKATRAPEGSPS
jgi:RNase P protein component